MGPTPDDLVLLTADGPGLALGDDAIAACRVGAASTARAQGPTRKRSPTTRRLHRRYHRRMTSKTRAVLVGAICGLAAWAVVLTSVNLDSERHLVLGTLPGAALLPMAWGRWLAARPTWKRRVVGLALPFLNVPLGGVLGWLLGVLLGPRGGVIGRAGGLIGVVLCSVPACAMLFWFLLPVGLLTTLVVSLAALPGRLPPAKAPR